MLLLACTLLLGLLDGQTPEKQHRQIFYTKTASFKKSSRILSLTFLEKVELKMYHGKQLLSSNCLSGHNTIPPTDSKLEQLVHHVINSTTGKYYTVAFI